MMFLAPAFLAVRHLSCLPLSHVVLSNIVVVITGLLGSAFAMSIVLTNCVSLQ